MASQRALRFLLAGGGTGGHIYPALAIAEALRGIVPDCEIQFVGAVGKMEMTRVPAAGFPIKSISVSGFHRGFDRRNLSFPFVLAKGMGQAWSIVKGFAPDAAIGTGGYVSGPALACASFQGVPTFLQEQNAFPGLTNRLLARRAVRVFSAYTEAESYFPKGKTLLTGNPLRKSIDRGSLPEAAFAKTQFGLAAHKPTLLSFGGSLGAASMNRAVVAMHDFWARHPDLQLIWQTGEGYYAHYRDTPTAALPNVACRPYLDRMDLAYAAADLVACRAGALSIAELQLLGKPAILIPSPNVAGDHQSANARAVEAAGGARVVEDRTQAEQLSQILPELLQHSVSSQRMREAMLGMAKPNAGDEIASQLVNYVRNHA